METESGAEHAAAEAWRTFAALLEAEHAALIANDGERIAALAVQKSSVALELAKLSLKPAPQLQALIAAAKALNQANLGLLQQRIAHNRHALALLRPTAPDAGAVYGPDGRAGRARAGQRVGIA